jgi:hypothetical protein
LWAKGLDAKDIHKEIFPVYGEKCLSCKAVHTWAEKRGNLFVHGEEIETEMRKCPRQKSKDFYAMSIDALAKRWDKRMNVGGGYVEK